METRNRILGAFAVVWSRSGSVRPPVSWPEELTSNVRRRELAGGGCWLTAFEGQDLAADRETLVAKIGVVRGAQGNRLMAVELLRRGLANPRTIDGASLRGNALVLALDLERPRLAAYSTFLAMPQLYHAELADGFVVASDLRLILPLLDRVEIDEEAVPFHFLFRFVPGERTYFRGVSRLESGKLLTIDRGAVASRRVRALRDVIDGLPAFGSIDEQSLAWLDRRMASATEAWVEEAEARGQRIGNLLSGGLDSSLVQAWLNDLGARIDRRSWSFTIDTPGFAFEVKYALEASALLATEHRFAHVSRERYLELFDRAIDVIASPSLYTEAWPCWLALADFVAEAGDAPTVMLAGNGADALHGFGDLRPITYWRQLSTRPGLRAKLLAALPELRARRDREAWVDALEMRGDPATLRDPLSYVSIAGELEIAVPAFGEKAVFQAFELRRQMASEQLASDDLIEAVQILDLVTTGLDPTLSMIQLVGSRGLDVLQVYMDEESIAAPFAFARDIRYLRHRAPWRTRPKPLQQALLVRRGLSALVGRKKGATNFTEDLWQWCSEGVLRDRVEEIQRPGWLSSEALAEMKRRPTYILWNLLTFDAFRRRVVAPASAAQGSR